MNDLHADLMSWEAPLEAPEEPVKQIVRELANPIEAVVNILYLIREERHDPDKVLQLTCLADGPVERLSQLVRKSLSQS